MTTVSRHTYTAETDLGVELSTPGGSITLDAGSIPHVTATATFSVEDAALIDELDPRDSRRIVIGATRGGHAEKVYTPWVEQARNRVLNPSAETNTTSWVAVRATLARDTARARFGSASFRVTPTDTSGGQYMIAGASAAERSPVTGGETLSVLASVWMPRAVGVALQVYEYNAAGTLLLPVLTSAYAAAPAEEWADISNDFTLKAAAASVRVVVIPQVVLSIGEAYWIDGVAAGTPVYFDGSTTSGELERTRWIGTANASASVLETRTIAGLKWVPEGFRFFDLGIRSCSPNRADGTVTVELASDEAILGDFAQLADDETPRSLEASLRGVVNYVLGKIGTALQPGVNDADVTAYWPVSLLNSNPAGMTNTNGYWAGPGASALASVAVASPAPALGTRAVRWTAAAGSSSVGVAGWDGVSTTKEGRVTPGRRYGTVVRMLSNPGRSTTVSLSFRDENGRHYSGVATPAQVTSIGAWTEFYLNAEAPPGAAYAYVSVTTAGNSDGQNHWVQAILYEGRWRIPMFYGDSTGGGYTYTWSGDVNASPSARVPITERDPESLVWSAGVSAMDFLHPILLTTGLRLVCDEQRRFTLRSEDYRAGGSQAWRSGVNVMEPAEKLSRDDESWFDAAVYVYTWTDAAGIEHTRTDAYSLTGTPTKVLRVEVSNTPYPGPGRAQHVVQRAQGKGREVTVTGIPTWLEQTDQALTIALDGTPIQTGISASIQFDLDTDTVKVTSRTTDTPAYAWQLIPAGQRWIDSPPGASWIGEVI